MSLPPAPSLPQGHHQRRDGGTAGALPHHGGLQHDDGQEGLRRRGRAALLDQGHGLLLRGQQGGVAAQDQPGLPGGQAQVGQQRPSPGPGADGEKRFFCVAGAS
jgi:hypothetical protein